MNEGRCLVCKGFTTGKPYGHSCSCPKEECALCDAPLTNTRQREVNMCRRCEVEMHGCSTGDCPHEMAGECQLALAELKRDQDEGEQNGV